ncbi:hypothetical protein QOZ80_2AG0099590 [Eleusine coracana subsp. coracana]|nr:hypothetical protein QOZ80_2AG0099590 [Eleusine coracana subsp. coracana]
MMSKRRRCEDEQPERRKHLYLVLDDWSNGFSIYKMGSDSFDDSNDKKLPEPAMLRLESLVERMPHSYISFSLLGTRIFVFMNQRCALVYNTETASMAVGPHVPAQMLCGGGIMVVAGDKLYALSYGRFKKYQHSFQVMSWAPTDPGFLRCPTEGWSWKTLPPPPPTFTPRQGVTSYALHTDGCTIFMTTANQDAPGDRLGTYSFNTKHSQWKWHGEWALPFVGQGYFDSELDAWVGLRRDGYICSCQVASRTSLVTKLGATLTYLGRKSKYCLVESVIQQGFDREHAFGDHQGYVLNVTIFRLSRNHKGELQTTNHNSTRSYLVSRHNSVFSPLAFWI